MRRIFHCSYSIIIFLLFLSGTTVLATSSVDPAPILFYMYNPNQDETWSMGDSSGEYEFTVTGVYLGCSLDNKWLPAGIYTPEGDLAYNFYSQTNKMGCLTGNISYSNCANGLFLGITDGEISASEKMPLIGITGDYNPIPRLPETVLEEQQYYEILIRGKLAVEYPEYSVDQVLSTYSIDMDGNGTNEILLVAKIVGNYYDPNAEDEMNGMDWITFFISNTNDTPQVQIVDDFVSIWADFIFTDTHQIFCDLNGDNVMEYIVREHYFESTGIYVYELTGDYLINVLSTGYGV